MASALLSHHVNSTKMKLNWGHKLVFFGASFMLFVLFMVYRISTQQVDLVDTNYYERGVKYQDELNKYTEAQVLKPQVKFDETTGVLTFTIEGSQAVSGTLTIYRPSDAKMDFTIPFVTDSARSFTYITVAMQKGLWKATFEWTLNDKLMAAEKEFTIE
jgi:hypothetical protein